MRMHYNFKVRCVNIVRLLKELGEKAAKLPPVNDEKSDDLADDSAELNIIEPIDEKGAAGYPAFEGYIRVENFSGGAEEEKRYFSVSFSISFIGEDAFFIEERRVKEELTYDNVIPIIRELYQKYSSVEQINLLIDRYAEDRFY